METLDETSAELQRAVSDPLIQSSKTLLGTLEKTIKAAKSGKSLLLQRQKYIKMVNQSEHRWKVVQEYETDDLLQLSDSGRRPSTLLGQTNHAKPTCGLVVEAQVGSLSLIGN